MENQSGQHDDEDQSHNEIDVRPINNNPKKSTHTEPAQTTTETHHKVGVSSTRLKQSWKMTSNWNKLMVAFTATIAISNGCYSCYARKQFVTMEGQLAQMKGASGQTDQLLCLYQKQLIVAQNTLAQSREQFRQDQRPT